MSTYQQGTDGPMAGQQYGPSGPGPQYWSPAGDPRTSVSSPGAGQDTSPGGDPGDTAVLGASGYPPPPSGASPFLSPGAHDSTAYDHAAYQTPPAPLAPLPPTPRRRRGLAGLLAAASLSAVIGAGAGIGSFALITDAAPTSSSTVGVTQTRAVDTPVLDGTIAAAAAKIQPSVVTITARSTGAAGGGGGVGTGVVMDDAGHILTNEHVVSGAGRQGRITVTLRDGTTAPATVVGTSPTNDLAVIKVDGVDVTPATFARSDSLRVGQAVVAAGAPLGLSESITSGIVSNTARPVRSGSNDDAVYLAVQTDAAINPGNSGGPLVDLNGAVVGINSAIASTGSQAGNIGIGFAIPADVAVRVAGELIADGGSTNAAMGVTVGGEDDAAATASTGVSLRSVVSGGAADRAGLRTGDVVTKINDFHTTTADGLIAATRFYAPGTEVTVTYRRDGGEATTAQVTLGAQ